MTDSTPTDDPNSANGTGEPVDVDGDSVAQSVDGDSSATGSARTGLRPDGGAGAASTVASESPTATVESGARPALSTLLGRPIVAGVVALAVAFLVVPVVATVIFSFAESAATGTIPRGYVTFDNWKRVLGFEGPQGNALPGLAFSIALATGGMVLNVLVGVPIAYALTRYDFVARDWLNTFAILPLVPGLILGIAFIQAYPEHGRSALGLIAGYCLLKSPYMVLTVQSSFESMDLERLEESARSLGASWPRTFLTIIVPHAKRGIVAGCIITWTLAAAEFNFTYTVASGSPDPFAKFLYDNIDNASHLQSAAAVSVYFAIVVAAILGLQLLGNSGFSTTRKR